MAVLGTRTYASNFGWRCRACLRKTGNKTPRRSNCLFFLGFPFKQYSTAGLPFELPCWAEARPGNSVATSNPGEPTEGATVAMCCFIVFSSPRVAWHCSYGCFSKLGTVVFQVGGVLFPFKAIQRGVPVFLRSPPFGDCILQVQPDGWPFQGPP